MKSPRLSKFKIIKYLTDMLAIIKDKVLDKVVCILEVFSIRAARFPFFIKTQALTNTFCVLLEVVCFSLVMKLQVIAQRGEIIQDDFCIAILVAVIFLSIFFEIGREDLIKRKCHKE